MCLCSSPDFPHLPLGSCWSWSLTFLSACLEYWSHPFRFWCCFMIVWTNWMLLTPTHPFPCLPPRCWLGVTCKGMASGLLPEGGPSKSWQKTFHWESESERFTLYSECVSVCLSIRAHLWHPSPFVSTIWCSRPYKPYIFWKLIICWWQRPRQRLTKRQRHPDTDKNKYKVLPRPNICYIFHK